MTLDELMNQDHCVVALCVSFLNKLHSCLCASILVHFLTVGGDDHDLNENLQVYPYIQNIFYV